MRAKGSGTVVTSYLGHKVTIGDRHVFVQSPGGGRPVRVTSVASARRLVKGLRKLEREAAASC